MEVEGGTLRIVVGIIIFTAAEDVTVYICRAFTSMSSSWWGVVGCWLLDVDEEEITDDFAGSSRYLFLSHDMPLPTKSSYPSNMSSHTA